MTLLELQRRMAGAIMAPLTASGAIARTTADGRRVRAEANELVKPNGRLTPVERLEIYSRSYWFRLLDSLYEDFPGLSAVVGPRAFNRLAEAYLAEAPSRSFTLRNLGSRLEAWLRDHPAYSGRNPALALDMVRLEWAHIEAFDNAAEKALGPEDLLDLGPGMRLALQPYITLLELRYPVDDLRLQVQAIADERTGPASNSVIRRKERSAVRRYSAVAPAPTFLAVHRLDSTVYYRRLAEEEFRILTALGRGAAVGDAVGAVSESSSREPEELGPAIETWFASWSRLGWFCRAQGTTR